MMSTPQDDRFAASLALYEHLVATHPEIERKGATMPYTSVNGHMFSFLTREGILALRLPAEDRELFLEAFQTRLCEQYGRVLEEYVLVPEALLQDTEALKSFFDISLAYVSALKPRPANREQKDG